MLDAVTLSVLPNGCRVATSVIPHIESVSVGLWAAVGARHEAAAEAGHSHFLEHMLFKGTARRSARRIAQAIEGRGGYLNAFTQQENTCYYARVPAEWTALALDVLADMYLAPRLAAEDIERERAVILEELSLYRDQPDAHVFDMLAEALWNRHPLGRPILGTRAAVQSVTRASLESFRARHYHATGSLFVVAGPIEHERVLDWVRPHAEALARGTPLRCRSATATTRQRPLRTERREIEQAHLALGFRCFGRHDPRRHALRILNAILGENTSSRLYQTLRERHGLCYSVGSSVQLLNDTGALTVSVGVESEQVERALTLTLRELRRLKQRPVSRAEFNRARDYVLGQLRLGLETAESQMLWVGESLLGYGRCVHPDETIAGSLATGPSDVQALANSLLEPGRASLALITPRSARCVEARFPERIATLTA